LGGGGLALIASVCGRCLSARFRDKVRAVWVGRRGDDGQRLRWLQGQRFPWGGQGLDASVAEPAVVVGEVAGRLDGLQMPGVGEVEGALVDAGVLQDVDISREQGEGDGTGGVDAGIFELAFDEEGDGDKAAGGGLGEVSGPLVDADCADDLLGLRDLVHLREGERRGEGCDTEEDAMEESSHKVGMSAKEIRRYLRGKVLLGMGVGAGISASIRIMDSRPLLEVKDLSIAFGQQEAVRGISFHISAGETLGLVGESGSGKSAASLAVLRLLPAAARVAGGVNFDGEDLLRLPEEAMRRRRGREIAMIFQEPMTALNPVMPVGAQIAEAVRAHDLGESRGVVRAKVFSAMEEVGLPDVERRAKEYPHQFSGGQRQRILIAMAIVNRPRLLIADEPTTALDVTVQAQILALLNGLRREHGLAMLFISHDLAVVAQVADRVAVMQRGEIVEQGAARSLFERPQHAYTRRLLASAPTMKTDRLRPLASMA
jgi:peptide/nickel transport system ATP-binding protein